MARHPDVITFLVTGVEVSTAAWARDPRLLRDASTVCDATLRDALAANGGHLSAAAGGSIAAAFERADAAVAAAVDAQAALAGRAWPGGRAMRVRMGLDTGAATRWDADFVGPVVNRAARAMDAANGAQILITGATRDAIGVDGAASFVDLGLHALRDVVEPVRLYRVESPRFTVDPRPPRTGQLRAGNLPPATRRLLGRDDDVDAVIADLDAYPLVTLVGAGGIGKTQLALEAARRVQARWPDGVWFVALDSVDRADAMHGLVAGTLGVEARDRGAGAVVDGLRFRDALLVLDNCEHLLDPVALLAADIIAACRGVRILATSREPLDVGGERARRVRPLGTDEDGPAVALFWERAAEAGVELDRARDERSVVEICARLDGIPLAIELAAARTRALRPSEIAARLDHMLGLLTSGRRGRVERHRTLRAALDWSYELLTDAERLVLDRLSVFSGPFTTAAAAAVAGAGSTPADVVVDVVERLVARSLVVMVDEGDDACFRLLEPVRQLAFEKLVDRGEVEDARERHASWYRDLMAALADRWRGGDDQGTWPVAQCELANLRSAFDHLVAVGHVDEAQRFAVDGFGVVGCQFDVIALEEWAPRSAAMAPAHVGPSTASAWAIAAWDLSTRGDVVGAADRLVHAGAALAAGSVDDGLVFAAATFNAWSGGETGIGTDVLEGCLAGAVAGDDLHRRTWVLSYADRPADALDAASRLGNQTLIALAYSGLVGEDDGERWEAAETFFDIAQASHSAILLNHAAHRLGVEQIRAGAPADGLLLLRTPLRDWLHRSDRRVWDVMHAVAWGLAASGDALGAARLTGAIGDRARPLHGEVGPLDDLLATIDDGTVERARRDGSRLDAGAATAEALARIDDVVAGASAPPSTDPDDLTPRQQEIAALVARGLTNKQIAHALEISRYTAETHVRNILERLGAASRSEIATWWAHREVASTAAGTPSRT